MFTDVTIQQVCAEREHILARSFRALLSPTLCRTHIDMQSQHIKYSADCAMLGPGRMHLDIHPMSAARRKACVGTARSDSSSNRLIRRRRMYNIDCSKRIWRNICASVRPHNLACVRRNCGAREFERRSKHRSRARVLHGSI